MKLDSLRKLFVHELKDLYSAEEQLLQALPKMEEGASDDELKKAFRTHLSQTREHVRRLDRVFKTLEFSPKGHKCKAMEGLIEEGAELLKEDVEPEVLDAALIAAAQRVEHYEIAGYGTARTYAVQLGETEAAELLQETLNEEGETDQLLTQLAEKRVNLAAARS